MTSTSAANKAMIEVLKSSPELLMRATLRVNRTQLSEEEQARYSEDEVRQMNGGFAALFLEALEGTGNDVRTMVVDTLIPGLVVKGETTDGIVTCPSCSRTWSRCCAFT